MPNRILREGILTSERIASLGWAEEVFYRRLMSVVDDYGRYYATPMLLRAACYPLHLNKVSDSDIEKWLTACVNAALVRVYPAKDGKRYLELLDFRQQVRAKESKFPGLQATCTADANQMLVACESSAHLGGGGVEDGCEDGCEDGGAAREPAETKFLQSLPAQICFALRKHGIASVQVQHPTLLALVQAGATVEEFIEAVDAAKSKSRPFEYLLSVVKGRREDAAKMAASVHQGPMPAPRPQETAYQRSQREQMASLAPGVARRDPATAPTTFDLETHDVTAIQSH